MKGSQLSLEAGSEVGIEAGSEAGKRQKLRQARGRKEAGKRQARGRQ